MIQLRAERTIAASPERVFNWLADPANFATPLASTLGYKAGYVQGSDPGVGAVREVTAFGNVWFCAGISQELGLRRWSRSS